MSSRDAALAIFATAATIRHDRKRRIERMKQELRALDNFVMEWLIDNNHDQDEPENKAW